MIETLLKRGFVVKKGKYLLATPIAADLMAVLPAQLKDPGMTALWEQSLDDIAEGRMSLDDFMAKQSARQRNWSQKGSSRRLRSRYRLLRRVRSAVGQRASAQGNQAHSGDASTTLTATGL